MLKLSNPTVRSAKPHDNYAVQSLGKALSLAVEMHREHNNPVFLQYNNRENDHSRAAFWPTAIFTRNTEKQHCFFL